LGVFGPVFLIWGFLILILLGRLLLLLLFSLLLILLALIGFEGFKTPIGEVIQSVEASKGELSYYIVSDGGNKPFRLRIRAPSFANLSVLPKMIVGQMIADVIAIIGSIDIVLGEIDR